MHPEQRALVAGPLGMRFCAEGGAGVSTGLDESPVGVYHGRLVHRRVPGSTGSPKSPRRAPHAAENPP